MEIKNKPKFPSGYKVKAKWREGYYNLYFVSRKTENGFDRMVYIFDFKTSKNPVWILSMPSF